MIQAVFKTDEKDQFVSFEVSGHAFAGEYGQDIVCAGVSAVVLSTVNNLTRMASIEPLIEADEENGGYLYVELTKDLSTEQGELAQMLLTSCYLALSEDVEANYGDFIHVSKTTKY